MTVKELIEAIKDFPEDMEIQIEMKHEDYVYDICLIKKKYVTEDGQKIYDDLLEGYDAKEVILLVPN